MILINSRYLKCLRSWRYLTNQKYSDYGKENPTVTDGSEFTAIVIHTYRYSSGH